MVMSFNQIKLFPYLNSIERLEQENPEIIGQLGNIHFTFFFL